METPISPEYQNLNQNTSPSIPQKNIYKILFFIFLGLFLIVTSVLATLLFTQKTSEISNITETEEQKTTPTKMPVSEVTNIPTIPVTKSTITPTSSNIPKDWKTYADSTYKFSISYPPEWTLETNINDVNRDPNVVDFFTIKSPEGEKEEKIIKSKQPSMEGYPTPCGFYGIYCEKSFNSSLQNYNQNFQSLVSLLKSDNFGNFTQSTTNGHILYSVIPMGLDGGKEFYIQNKDTSFCVLQFCSETASGKELTPTEKQFVNTFKFN